MSRLSQLYFTPRLKTSLGGVKRLISHHNSPYKIKVANAEKWLRSREAYSLHKPARRKFTRRKTIVSGIGEQLQADLIDMQRLKKENDGMAYLLTAIDVFSKRAWAIPIRSKSGEHVSAALNKILSNTNFRALQTDKGKEFLNKRVQDLLKENNVHHFTTENETIKASIVERLNKTLQTTLYRWFTYKNNSRYVDALDDVMDSYNNRYHTSIGMSPNEVSANNQEDVWLKMYPPKMHKIQPKLRVGDYVRISKARMTFERGYTASWTTEVYTIDGVQRTNPIVYTIKDLSNEKILGTFYEHELQQVTKPTSFKIEKVIKRQKRGRKYVYYVKWLGYPDSFNQWILQDDLV